MAKNQNKYPLRKDEIEPLFQVADMAMEGNYHEIYKKIGWVQGKNRNFHCFNDAAHSGGKDSNASVSVNKKTGQWHCFTCGIQGNLQSYWVQYLKGTAEYGDSITDFLIDLLGLQSRVGNLVPLTEKELKEREEASKLMQFHSKLMERYEKMKGQKHIITSQDIIDMMGEVKYLDMKIVDEATERLLNNQDMLDYLLRERNITPDVISKYNLGWYKHETKKKDGGIFSRDKFLFPMINSEGKLVNIKLYDPFAKNTDFKWVYPFKDRKSIPGPIDNMTYTQIMITEGEPDCYCAISFGFHAITMGSKSVTDVNEAFGVNKARELFSGKEVVIMFDADKAGRDGAFKVAHSVYGYAKQVKIIDLDQSDINPDGLDPNLMKTVVKNGIEKQKRAETDFTDFMKKNGFGDTAKQKMYSLIDSTPVYNENPDRGEDEVYKVTLKETRYPRYYSDNGKIKLKFTATVSNIDQNSLLYPELVKVKCAAMKFKDMKRQAVCKRCLLKELPDFDGSDGIDIHMVRDVPEEHRGDFRWHELKSHEILGLVKSKERSRDSHIKDILEIPSKCSDCRFQQSNMKKLINVQLSTDVSAFDDNADAFSDIDVEAYVEGDSDIKCNFSYHFTGSQTTSWDKNYAVVMVSNYEPISTTYDDFVLDQETYNTLKIFQRRDGESIQQALDRRYKAFGAMAGISGRDDMIQMMDLTYMSASEINNKMIPSIHRGYLECLILGETRCGKSVIAKFLNRHYKIGDMAAGGSTVTRSGLVGGIGIYKNKGKVVWGKIPINDNGMVIIDELSNLDISTLDDMTAMRSEGSVEITMSSSARARARTRKIMLSNARENNESKKKNSNYGVELMKDLCFNKDQILSRFDFGMVVRADDVSVDDFVSDYSYNKNEFTSFQCQTLIKYIYSRKTSDYIFEDGFEEYVNEKQKEMLEIYHPSTLLVNVEMRAKLIRIAIAFANSVFNVDPENVNKIIVTSEHVDAAVNYLRRVYDGPNMKMDIYSRHIWRMEKLGDMRFMQNVLKYVNPTPLVMESEFTDKSIQQIFADYFIKVNAGQIGMVSANNDDECITGLRMMEATIRFISTLVARNCMFRSGTKLRKTAAFTKWLQQYERALLHESIKPPVSNILENSENQFNIGIYQVSGTTFKVHKKNQA